MPKKYGFLITPAERLQELGVNPLLVLPNYPIWHVSPWP